MMIEWTNAEKTKLFGYLERIATALENPQVTYTPTDYTKLPPAGWPGQTITMGNHANWEGP